LHRPGHTDPGSRLRAGYERKAILYRAADCHMVALLTRRVVSAETL